MIFKQSNGYTLWGSCHPVEVGCIAEGRPQCECKFHIVKGDEIYSFEEWPKADKKFADLTGTKEFIFGKTVFN